MVKNGSLFLTLLAAAASSVLAAPYCICENAFPALTVNDTPTLGAVTQNPPTYQKCAAACEQTPGCDVGLINDGSDTCGLFEADFARNGQTSSYPLGGIFASKGNCASFGIDPAAAGSPCFDYETPLTPSGGVRRRALTANQRRRAAAALGAF